MGEMLKNMGRDVGDAMKIFALPAEASKAAVNTLKGQPFFSTVRNHSVDALYNVLALPPRLAWDMITGLAKGTLHLTWEAIKLLPLPLPMLQNWGKDRQDVALRTKDSLELFRFDMDHTFDQPPLNTLTQK